MFVSPKKEEGSNADLTFEGVLEGNRLSSTLNGPDGKTWSWIGERAPSLDRLHTPEWDKPIELFNGKDLSGWHESKPGPPDWIVKEGNLVSPGNGPELVSDSTFRDFRLHIEFNCNQNSNSGVYLRGRYEVQIETNLLAEPPGHHTGAVYGFIAPKPELPRNADVWQAFDITLVERTVTVVQNGRYHYRQPGDSRPNGRTRQPRKRTRTDLSTKKRKGPSQFPQHHDRDRKATHNRLKPVSVRKWTSIDPAYAHSNAVLSCRAGESVFRPE